MEKGTIRRDALIFMLDTGKKQVSTVTLGNAASIFSNDDLEYARSVFVDVVNSGSRFYDAFIEFYNALGIF